MSEMKDITKDKPGTVIITVIYDNNPMLKDLQTDWGFSCLIEIRKNKILFDTGDNGKILLANMDKLGIDPHSIDIVFLSHFHHDHTGGLQDYLKVNSKVKVYYPQSFPKEIVDVIKNSGAESIPVFKSMEILPDVFTLGEIDGKIPEQSLVVKLPNELIVITGCAHPGIINILQKAKDKFPDELIYLALGGFHLHRLNEEEINKVIQKMFTMEILSVAPTHCSGNAARIMFKEVFDADYTEVGVGKVIAIN
jgi:7,8-dihydropterin-6-yl-methyl-4-(beta-D-ribofuranosyl)aminobenzene 5'-phosphate synthase